jgi:hypothetical protein
MIAMVQLLVSEVFCFSIETLHRIQNSPLDRSQFGLDGQGMRIGALLDGRVRIFKASAG